MATLPNGTYANPGEPLYASAYGTNTNLTMNSLTLTGSPPLVLTNDAGVLKQNGFSDILTSLWSTTPATSNKIYMDTSNILSNVGSNLYFAGTLLADAGAVPNIADWSLYPQLSNINGNSFSISNSSGYSGTGNITTTGGNITTSSGNVSASGNVSGASGTFPTLATAQINGTGTFGNLGITSSNEIIVNADAINSTSGAVSFDVDGGINIINYSDFEVNASNGNRGRINMTAGPGFSNGVFGEMNLTANGGLLPSIAGSPSYATGGLINLTATTPVGTILTSTSAIKLSASSVLSYAGSVSPVFSTAGYNYVYGQVGVNIICSTSPPVIPSLPLSIYMYSDAGTRISNGLRTDTITNIGSPTGTLAISGSGVGSIVTLSNVRSIAGSSPATITGFSNITTSNIGLSTINNTNYVATSSWATLPATQSVNLSNFQISNCTALESSAGLGVYGNAVTIGAIGSNSNVEIQANNGSGNIVLTPGSTGNVTAPRLVVSSNITTSNINLSNINGVPYSPAPATWSSYPATTNLNISNFSISNATGLSSSSSLTLAGQGIALNSTGANNLTMTTASTGNISMTAGGGALITTTTGDIELTAGGGSLIDMKSGVNMFNNSIVNAPSISTSNSSINITSSSNTTITSSGATQLVSGTGDIEFTAGAGRKIDMFSDINLFNNNISNVSNIVSATPIIVASTGQLSLTSSLNNDVVVTTTGTGRVVLNTSPSGRVEVPNTMRMNANFERVLDNPISQPVFQYGDISSTGNSGNQLVTLTDTYTTTSSYSVQVSMEDTSPAQMSVNRLTTSTFRIYWANAGSGSHTISWLAYGV
jgi:hypothetical protein